MPHAGPAFCLESGSGASRLTSPHCSVAILANTYYGGTRRVIVKQGRGGSIDTIIGR